jgi:hypothetical protein
MRTVFLSCHFGDSDRELVRQAEGLLESHGLRVITGEELGGGVLTAEVMDRIERSEALVALMTKRTEPPDYGGTHPWVVEEFKHAKARKKPAIALVAPGVALAGANQDAEHIEYDPQNRRKAFLKLSKTIGVWKSKAGRLLKVQLLPPALADQVATANRVHIVNIVFMRTTERKANGKKSCRCRSDGTYVYLKGITEEVRIQLRVELAGTIWISRVLAQGMPVELRH